ncbi:MAG TPA: hypothetical protein VMG11_04635 [Steroidobacteraceae bacterium]|nr:hypothetical protein [Steroidobacteraceae bacterium]
MAVQRNTTWWDSGAMRGLAWALACAGGVLLGACSSGTGTIVQTAGGQAADPQTQDFPIFYVKRYSVPATQDDLRLLRFAQPSADLFMRSNASPGGTEVNITQSITGTGTAMAANYDVKDVSVSYDGSAVLFAMRGPLAPKMKQDAAPSWRIYQYVIATHTLSPVINPTTDPDPATVNDTAPQFLPDGRIVFSSTRQRQGQAVLLDEGFPQFVADDEARTEPAAVLHVMNADGSDIHQISFNPSHDRDPTVLLDGQVMWTRWDNPPGKDGMQLYTANPDGTNLQLFYGANSHATGPNGTTTPNAIVEFVKSHEMQDGRILALIRPYMGQQSMTAPLGTDFGGDLVIIDAKNYVENNQPAQAGSSLSGPAQTPATPNNVLTIPGPSPGGRFYAGYPLWDGTGRILVSWSECRLLDNTATTPVLLPCTTANLANTALIDAPPIYSVWMFDAAQNTMQPITLPVDGIMITDLAAAQPRTLPGVILDGVQGGAPGPSRNANLYAAGVGLLDIRSVYDFDGVDTAKPNIPTLADPAKTTAAQRPARFVRITQAVALPNNKQLKLNNAAFGVSNFMRMILGYAPVEPDGSVEIEVPANVPFQIDILDANAQRISTAHNAWLQVAAGETLKCNGCHTPAAAQNPAPGQTALSHGRAGVFDPAYAGAGATGVPFPNTVAQFSPNQGDTMAETRARWSCANDMPACFSTQLTYDVLYTDVWTNTSGTGLALNPPIAYQYKSLTTPAPANSGCITSPTSWLPTCRIVVNYIEHVQLLWDAPRPALDAMGNVIPNTNNTCSQAGCHSPTDAMGNTQVPAGQLDLSNTPSNQQPLQLVSYIDLLSTHDELQLVNGALVPVTAPGPIDPTTGKPTQVTVTVPPPMSASNARGSTLFFSRFAPGSGDNIHAGILNPSELRLLSEWLDIGAQYFNNPFDPKAPLN